MEKLDSMKLEDQLCFPLYACAREIVKAYRPSLEALGLTYTQYITMMVLWEENRVSVKDLGRRLHLDSGTLTPLLKKLEEKGYLQRERSTKDERVVIASITGNGVRLRTQAAAVPAAISRLLGDFSATESDQLYRLLYHLMDILDQGDKKETKK
jgi:DNA-binding MarR family transcriptional regulator